MRGTLGLPPLHLRSSRFSPLRSDSDLDEGCLAEGFARASSLCWSDSDCSDGSLCCGQLLLNSTAKVQR